MVAKGPQCQAETGTEQHACPPSACPPPDLHPMGTDWAPPRAPIPEANSTLDPPSKPHTPSPTPAAPHPKGSKVWGGSQLPPQIHPGMVQHQPRTVHGLTPPPPDTRTPSRGAVSEC